MTENIICHNIEPFNQPEPTRNKGGDCFACATLAALRWLYPEKKFEFDQVWDSFKLTQTNPNGDSFEFLGNSWLSYSKVFEQISKKMDLPDLSWRINSCYPTFIGFGRTAGNWNRDNGQYGEYWQKLCEDLKTGVVILSINKDGEGPWKNGCWNEIDHLVLIDGVRKRTIPVKGMPWASKINWEVRIVCSRNGCVWKTIWELLDLHGAGAWHVLEKSQNKLYKNYHETKSP